MSTSTLPARATPAWFRLGLLSVSVIALCWSGALWYWRANGHLPAGPDLLTGLLILPLGVLGACWAGNGALKRRAPIVAAPIALASAAVPTVLACATPVTTLSILGTSLRMPHGAAPDALLALLARGKAQPDLAPELVDDDGFPVMTARSDDAVDELLQEEIAEWLAQRGLADVVLSEEGWRALTLGTVVLRELAQQSTAFLAQGGVTLRLSAVLPAQWSPDERHAAGEWWQHLLAQWGWPAARIRVELAQPAPGATPSALLARLVQEAGDASGPTILLACESHIGQDTIDRWSAAGLLFSAAHPQGLVPGEGAAGLLLAGAGTATLLRLVSMACEPAATSRKRIDPVFLARLAGHALQDDAALRDSVALIVADTGAATRHLLELMEFSAATTPQLDSASDILALGQACGACGAVPFVAALALARSAALEQGTPVLCISNDDTSVRAVALVSHPIDDSGSIA